MDGASAEWTTYRAAAAPETHDGSSGVLNAAGVHGTGAVAVTGARFVAEDGRELHILEHGRPARLDIDFAVFQPDLRERCQVVLALHKDGIEDVCRFITRDLVFDASQRSRGTIRLTVPRLTLTDGSYAVTVMIAREGYYDT